MKLPVLIPALLIAYLLVAVVTFGHAMNTLPKELGQAPLMSSLASSMFWPLYVSTQAWAPVSVQSVSVSPAVEGGAR